MMVANITYTKTTRGQRALIKELPDAVGQVLTVMEGEISEAEILNRLHNVSERAFKHAMTWLLEGGFIKLIDSTPLSFAPSIPFSDEAIQVQEISIDEFAASTDAKGESKSKPIIMTKADDAADKEKARLAAIQTVKRLTAAKTEEVARLNAEAEDRKRREATAKKEEWARLKTEAENKMKLEQKEQAEIQAKAKALAEVQQKEKAELEAKEKAGKWAQLKAEAKARAEEELKLQVIAKAEQQIKRQRLANHAHSKNWVRQGLIKLLNGIKSLFIVTLIVLCLLIAAAHFINLFPLIAPIERFASAQMGHQVKIQSVNISLFPRPHLLLKRVSIVDSASLHAQKIRIYPDLFNIKNKVISALTLPEEAPYKIQLIKIEGLALAQKDLFYLPAVAKMIANNQQYTLQKLTLENTDLQINGLSLPPLNADIALNASNVFKQAKIQSSAQDFTLTVTHINGDYLIDLFAMNWRLPLAPFPAFTQLSATGIIKNEDVSLSSVTGQLYGGQLAATLHINLASPKLASEGRFQLSDVMIDKIAQDLQLEPVVTGSLNSQGHFYLSFTSSSNTLNPPHINASFNIQNGVIKKIDIAEAMRTKNINGTTSFSMLTGDVSLKNNHYQFTHLFLQDKQLQAYGQVAISADQQVAASISSVIAIPDNPIHADLAIKGPVTALKLIN